MGVDDDCRKESKWSQTPGTGVERRKSGAGILDWEDLFALC